MNKKIKIIFIGTSDFGEPSLRALAKENNFNLIGAITQPDKQTGRKQILTPPPIKILAQKLNIPVWQPEKIKTFAEKIKKIKPDLIVVIAYAQLIPENILSIPPFGAINIHGSLLPKYRGAACVQAPILNKDPETGITIIKMDKGLDTGPILMAKKIRLEPNETAGSLFNKLSDLAEKNIVAAVKEYSAGRLIPRPQGKAGESYAKRLKKSDGEINFSRPADEIQRFIRAMTPWPSAFFPFNKKRIIILEIAAKSVKINKYQPGDFFLKNNDLLIQCGRDSLIIKKLQLSGKKSLSANEFIRGYRQYIK